MPPCFGACWQTDSFTRKTIAPDRKSTRLNSSHLVISYAVFCLKKKSAPHTAPLHLFSKCFDRASRPLRVAPRRDAPRAAREVLLPPHFLSDPRRTRVGIAPHYV